MGSEMCIRDSGNGSAKTVIAVRSYVKPMDCIKIHDNQLVATQAADVFVKITHKVDTNFKIHDVDISNNTAGNVALGLKIEYPNLTDGVFHRGNLYRNLQGDLNQGGDQTMNFYEDFNYDY